MVVNCDGTGNVLYPLHEGYLVECLNQWVFYIPVLTSFGVFWSTNVARNWYRNEKYLLIPEKPGIRRGIPREGDTQGYP